MKGGKGGNGNGYVSRGRERERESRERAGKRVGMGGLKENAMMERVE